MLLKKCTGQVKGRVCADGHKKWLYMHKKNTTSPTVPLGYLFTCSWIKGYSNYWHSREVHSIWHDRRSACDTLR